MEMDVSGLAFKFDGDKLNDIFVVLKYNPIKAAQKDKVHEKLCVLHHT